MQIGLRKRSFVHYLPIYGCFSTGFMYGAIGLIAILSYFKVMSGGADETSLIALMNHSLVGKIFIWVILGGTLSYISWRIFESLKDPYGYGNEPKGLMMRTGIALSTLADGLIVYSSVKILLGMSDSTTYGPLKEEHHMMDNWLQHSWGQFLMIALGIIILVCAIVLSIYGFTKGYKERLEVENFDTKWIKVIHALAMIGFLSRSIILGLIGFFYCKAGGLDDAFLVVNTDKAFDFIGDHLGGTCFLFIATGTICYGIFTFALGIGYDVDKD